MHHNHRAMRTNALPLPIPRPIPRPSNATIPSLYPKDQVPAPKIPAPYNVPWTGHLIKRDLKDLKDKIKAKTKKKIDKLWGKSTPALVDRAEAFYNSDKFAVRFSSGIEDDDLGDSARRTRQDRLSDRNRTDHMEQNDGALPPFSKNTIQEQNPDGLDFDFSDKVIADLWADFDGAHFDDNETDEESVYAILTAYLNVYWDDRPKDEKHAKEYISHEERFRTRGLLILLRLLLENCPSSPMNADLNKGQECFDEATFKLELEEEVNVIKLKAILSNLSRYQLKVSMMPGELNHKWLSSVHLRFDSLLTEEEQAKQIEEQISAAALPSPSELWFALMVACSERSMTQKVVTPLLRLVEPEMDVDKFLIRIGNPAQMVPFEEKDVLRKKLLPFLFPEFNELV